jgi:hypothetical protein
MFGKINENIVQNSSTTREQNTDVNQIRLNAKEPENQEYEKVPNNSFKDKLINNIDENNNNISININNINNIERGPIFRVMHRTLHSGDDIDNIKQMVVTDFINFFLKFINFIINGKIKEEGGGGINLTNKSQTEIEFKIGCTIKPKIKFEDIIKLNVEKLLSFESYKYYKNLKKENDEKEKIKEIKNIIGSSLDKLFETQVIDLFKDIYYKEISNETDKEIDLKKYGIEGTIFKITEEIPTFQKLKGRYKNNKVKINKMDEIVESNIIKPKKFYIKKKK